MRYLIAFVLVAAGCTYPPPETMWQTAQRADETATAAAPTADLDALAREVTMLQARLAFAEIRVRALETSGAGKVPHLVTVDGADLGPFAGWDRWWLPEIGEYVPTDASPTYHASPDCSDGGVVFVDRSMRHSLSPDGEYLRVVDLVTMSAVAVRLWEPMRCQSRQQTIVGWTWERTGHRAPSMHLASGARIVLH